MAASQTVWITFNLILDLNQIVRENSLHGWSSSQDKLSFVFRGCVVLDAKAVSHLLLLLGYLKIRITQVGLGGRLD